MQTSPAAAAAGTFGSGSGLAGNGRRLLCTARDPGPVCLDSNDDSDQLMAAYVQDSQFFTRTRHGGGRDPRAARVHRVGARDRAWHDARSSWSLRRSRPSIERGGQEAGPAAAAAAAAVERPPVEIPPTDVDDRGAGGDPDHRDHQRDRQAGAAAPPPPPPPPPNRTCGPKTGQGLPATRGLLSAGLASV